ncbi:MAG: acetoacetate--CoA ligase [Pseudomonadota bacterium]
MTDTPLWMPSADRIADAAITRFMTAFSDQLGRDLDGYDGLHEASIAERGIFWSLVWDFCGVVGDRGDRTLATDAMPGADFFPDARLNYAENLLRQTGAEDALVFWGEDKVRRRLSWDELRSEVAAMRALLAASGVGEGDRVAAMLPNMPEAIITLLATASLGAIFSSCSPDFGVQGVLDRFGQIEPKVFVTSDGYWYNGKRIDIAGKLGEIRPKLATAGRVFIADYLGNAEAVAAKLDGGAALSAALAPHRGAELVFTPMPFSAPLYILYSSGTTGVPKCIVYCAGGALLQHMKEHQLQADIRAGDRLFYFSTCGWMMWNWLVTGLASGATLLLYDGSPFAPGPEILFDYADQERMTQFGTSAKYIDAVKKSGLRPRDTHDLSTVRLMTSTGSPLAPESFDFVYDGIKPDIHLASISGGTDIVSCFVLGSPIDPVWRSEIQRPGLGMAVEVWDESGVPLGAGVKGELVCTKSFPTMPVMFWNDPDGVKYRAAYFDRFPGVWCHGDFAEWTDHGGMIIHGRSDATLNPGGVRIGTAEIYAQVEQMPEIIEALAIGQDWDNDVRIVLFVRLADGVEMNESLRGHIKSKIRDGASPRHVPQRILAVGDIPRTKSGKITELAVRDVVHGRPVKNVEALANPEALDLYADLEPLKS